MAPRHPFKNILLVGAAGSGKTSVLQRTISLLPKVRFGGFFVRALQGGPQPPTRAATAPGQREPAARHLVLVRGRQRELADRPVARHLEGTRVTVVDPTSLSEDGLPCLEEAMRDSDVVVLDELDRLAAASAELEGPVRAAFECSRPVLASARVADEPWLEELAERADTLVIEVLRANRTGLEQELADRLMAALEAPAAEQERP
jgi:nucleoside-triphosphatase THEP1